MITLQRGLAPAAAVPRRTVFACCALVLAAIVSVARAEARLHPAAHNATRDTTHRSSAGRAAAMTPARNLQSHPARARTKTARNAGSQATAKAARTLRKVAALRQTPPALGKKGKAGNKGKAAPVRPSRGTSNHSAGNYSAGKSGRRHHPQDEPVDNPIVMKQARLPQTRPAGQAQSQAIPQVSAQHGIQMGVQVGAQMGVQTDDPAADYLASVQAQQAAASALPITDATPALQQSTLRALRSPSRDDLTAAAIQPVLLPGLYRNGRLVVPAPLKGTHDILVHQNRMADAAGLERIQDDDDLRRLRAARLLVDFPVSASLHLNPDLNEDRRCARIWTVRFAIDTARAFAARFGQPLQVNSAVRTVAYQLRLQRTNGNAAAVDGDGASPHLTGQAIDLGKRGMSLAQIAWMRAYLKPLMDAGKIDVEEEFQQACFHISVYRGYLPATRRTPRTDLAQK